MKDIFAQPLFAQSSTKLEMIGTPRICSRTGRKYRYAYAGEDLAVGKMSFMATATGNHVNKSVASAAAIGDYEVTVTVGATAVTADSYANGFLHVNDGTGQGHQYLIDSNTYCASSGNTTVTLHEPIRVALVASATSEVSLIANPWSSVTQSTTEESGSAGVTPIAVTSGYYFWCQTGGPAICLASGSDGLGSVLSHDATEGAIAVMANYTMGLVGFTWYTAHVSTEYKPIWLTID